MNRIKNILLFLIVASIASCHAPVSNNSGNNVFEKKLCDTLATIETINLYNNLAQLAPQKVLVGHQDDLAYGIGWKAEEFRSDINDVCGDYPAIFGWDLGHIGDSVNIDSVSFKQMKNWALKAYSLGGINTYGWHSRNFVVNANSWDTTPCVAEILPGGSKHEAYLLKLNLIADFFASLKNEKGELIPLFFRPFHEMNGGWFWWGTKSCTTDEYKDLWRFTVDYLRGQSQLHNIIYVYSTDVFESAEDYLKYYPGDDYVDILGYDDYKGLNNKQSTLETVKMLEVLADLSRQKGKLYTISETGLETIPNPVWFTDVVLSTIKTNASTRGISYILFWRNGRPDHFYAPYPEHASVPDFIKFKNDSITLFLSQTKNIYSNVFF